MRSTLGALARLVRGSIATGSPDGPFEGGVSIDSRTLRRGDLFVAIQGPRNDGHDYLREVVERGARGVLVSKEVEVPSPVFVIRVADTTRALQDLAQGVREQKSVRVVGITGSMGKTTTKEAAACAIASRYKVLKSEGNLNNAYGLPLTLLRLEDEDVAVLEMGMSSPGEIARLTEIARPDVGLVTNVAEVHLEFFASIEEIAEAKGELFEGLAKDATAVVNADDPLVLAQARRFAGRKIRFAMNGDAEITAHGIQPTPTGLRFTARYREDEVEVATSLRGRHNVENLLAGIAAASALDVSLRDAAEALARLAPARHRGERLLVRGDIVVIDETYNSNPRALRSAIDALAEETASRRIAVLGDMLELGERAEEMHREVGRYAVGRGIDRIVGVGELGRAIVDGALEAGAASDRLASFSSAEEAGACVANDLEPGDVLLFKASRGVALERAIDRLRAATEEAKR